MPLWWCIYIHTYIPTYIPTYIHTYIPLHHYITLPYITLPYLTLPYLTFHTYIHTITLHYLTLHYLTLHSIHTYIHIQTHTHIYIHTYINYIHTYHYITLPYLTLPYLTFHTYIHTYTDTHTYIHTLITYIHTYQHTNIPTYHHHRPQGGGTRRTIPPPQATGGGGPEEPYHHHRPQGGGPEEPDDTVHPYPLVGGGRGGGQRCTIYNTWSVSWNAVLRGPQSLSESCDLWMPLVYIMKLCIYIYMVYMKLNSNCCHNGEWPFWARTRSEACTILQTLGWLLDFKHVCWLVEGCVGPTGPNMSQSFSCHKTFRRVAEVGSLWHCRLTPLTLSLWDC